MYFFNYCLEAKSLVASCLRTRVVSSLDDTIQSKTAEWPGPPAPNAFVSQRAGGDGTSCEHKDPNELWHVPLEVHPVLCVFGSRGMEGFLTLSVIPTLILSLSSSCCLYFKLHQNFTWNTTGSSPFFTILGWDPWVGNTVTSHNTHVIFSDKLWLVPKSPHPLLSLPHDFQFSWNFHAMLELGCYQVLTLFPISISLTSCSCLSLNSCSLNHV